MHFKTVSTPQPFPVTTLPCLQNYISLFISLPLWHPSLPLSGTVSNLWANQPCTLLFLCGGVCCPQKYYSNILLWHMMLAASLISFFMLLSRAGKGNQTWHSEVYTFGFCNVFESESSTVYADINVINLQHSQWHVDKIALIALFS